jgi:hypothetical protein
MAEVFRGASMTPRRWLAALLTAGCLLAWGTAPLAAVWKSTGQIGFTGFAAQVDDSKNPMIVDIRVENHSKLAAVSVSRFFVQMTDGDNKPLRPVTADEIVSARLQKLRELLPQNVNEIDQMMGQIQADYPQQKIVDVYARLKQFMSQNRPTGWRSNFENWVAGKRYSTDEELKQAQGIIEEIGSVAQNYLWPRDVAPDTVYTGLVFFERPPKDPLHIFFEIDKQFLGNAMTLDSGDTVKPAK